MARMHSRRRGSSGSDRPTADEPPEWSDVDTEAIEERVVELAEEGHDPSQIGHALLDGLCVYVAPLRRLVCRGAVRTGRPATA